MDNDPDLTIEELTAHWERILSAEGLSERIYKKQIRGPRGTPQRNLAQQREVVVAPDQSWVWEQALPDATRAPENALQAFMEAAPHQNIERDKETAQALREALLDAMEELLDEDTADLVCRRYFGQASIAELSNETGIPLSTLSERILRAVRTLREELPNTPAIADYLNGDTP